jgi:hypothetical protein
VPEANCKRKLAIVVTLSAIACTRTRAIDAPATQSTDAEPTVALEAGAPDAPAPEAAPPPWAPSPRSRIDGPHEELSLDAGRPIYYAAPRATAPYRLIGHLHGMCGPPSYACGKWISAGTELGIMVCPTGNARCGDSPVGPPSWEAPTWLELVALMDKDLETSIAKIEAKRPGTIDRKNAILTGYSRGAYAAPVIARTHPNRWPYLLLIEANMPLAAASLRTAGVRAVALVAGELGAEIAGMRKTQSELEAAGFPAKLFVMRRTSHPYSDDMEYVMHDALTFLNGVE